MTLRLPSWLRTYLLRRRSHGVTWKQVAWFFVGGWAITGAAIVDHLLPATFPRDLLYLVPLGLTIWQLGRSVAWYFVLSVAGVRAMAIYGWIGAHALPAGTAHDAWAVTATVVASAIEYGAFAWIMLSLRDAIARERYRADQDALTGLLTRHAFTTAIEAAGRRKPTSERRRQRRCAALAYLDLDGFKGVNDQHGHDAGDAVLRLVADVIRSAVRGEDVIARLGGDEFAIWLPGADAVGARIVGERMLAALVDNMRAEGWAVSASVGIAAFAEPPGNIHAAITLADRAMYQVKRSGKGRVSVVEIAPETPLRAAS